jgi:hypothetical protein
MKIKRSLVIALAGAIPILGGVSAYAFYENANPPAVAEPVATPDPSLAMPAPAPSSAPAKPDKHAMLGDAMATASTYLGISATDLKSQLQGGKSLADVANATAGKSRDGLVAALSTAANAKIDAQVTAGTLTSQQAAMAKQKSATEIATLVDRAGLSHN